MSPRLPTIISKGALAMKTIVRRVSAVLAALLLLVTSASALSVDQALELLEDNYLRDIPAQAYEAEDLDQLFDLLDDPYTYYMDAGAYQAFLNGVEGTSSVVGIGILAQYTDQGILVSSVVTGSGAQAAGLQPNDLIVAVDGVSCVPASADSVALLTGEVGTAVTVTVLRAGTTWNCTIIRQQIVVPNTEFGLLDGHIGYIDCASFGSDTGSLFASGLTRYTSQTDFWLVDLRSNPGGYTSSAVEAVGAFAGPGYYLYLRDKQGSAYPYSYLQSASTDHPVIVLVNSGSASASEAFASGIRDSGVGIVVGTRTYGKGVAQVIFDHGTHSEYFDDDAMKVTTYRFYSQAGNTTDQIGVIPTLLVSDLYAPAVAQALCASPDLITDHRLMLRLDDQYFFLDLDKVDGPTLSALFSALSPAAQLWVGRDTYYWDEISVEDAAALLGVDYTSRRFTDVAASPYEDEINTLASYYLLLGDGTGKYLPEGQLTRAQMCAMFAHILNVDYQGPSFFSDVADGVWYADDVNAMASIGLVEGVGGDRFAPDRILTQQEFITMLGRMARFLNCNLDWYAQLLKNGEVDLADAEALAPLASWARESAAVLAWAPQETLGKVNSPMLHVPLEELSPNAPILREEAAACLYRVLTITGILTV